jgi:hypothetical protein
MLSDVPNRYSASDSRPRMPSVQRSTPRAFMAVGSVRVHSPAIVLASCCSSAVGARIAS